MTNLTKQRIYNVAIGGTATVLAVMAFIALIDWLSDTYPVAVPFVIIGGVVFAIGGTAFAAIKDAMRVL